MDNEKYRNTSKDQADGIAQDNGANYYYDYYIKKELL